MIKRIKIAQTISEALKKLFDYKLSAEDSKELFELPKSSKLGDLAFPCFTLAKDLRAAPQQIALKLAQHLNSMQAPERAAFIKEVRAEGPYLNFFFDLGVIAKDIVPQILDGTLTLPEQKKSTRRMIEYSQPNTHKAFHVGHLRNATLGDTLTRLSEWCGYSTVPVNYIGDEGTHVAKCLWYFKKHFKGEVPNSNRGEFLGELYTKATLMLDLSSYTAAPFPGVTVAKVLTLTAHPSESEWMVVALETSQGHKQVVTGSLGLEVGELVAWAKPGAKVATRNVTALEKKGVQSEGMICSFEELGLSESKDLLKLDGRDVGDELAEVFRFSDTGLAGGILTQLELWQAEVGEVLSSIENKEPQAFQFWQTTREWSLQEFYSIYQWINCRFDHYFFESEFAESGKELVRDYQKKGLFRESEGAVGADLSDFNLGFCILIKRDGNANYATRDLALARKKFEDFGIDTSIYVVDAAQSFHFNQVFKCLELMGYEQAKNCHHLSYGQVVLPDGKMSSRKGNVILFSDLKNRLLEKINNDFLDKYKMEWPLQEIQEAGKEIAVATMRYGMLNQDNNSNIIFDLNAWTEKSGNTGPYLLYAYARISSIMREVDVSNLSGADYALLNHETEEEVLRHLMSYRDVVKSAADNYSPLFLCVYLYELAKRFSRMYGKCSVVNAESSELRLARAGLVKSVGEVLKHGLSLLGIGVLKRM
jgi:arginyl-tRNA synthetase